MMLGTTNIKSICSHYQNSAQERLETLRRLCYDRFVFNKYGSSNPVSEFFVLPQDWCQAIARDEKLTCRTSFNSLLLMLRGFVNPCCSLTPSNI
jgi:hypothetical protein